ncbi:hypothetical protein [Terasakiella pusilla]|jgi:hypothetical protein|uniref:hypothetical protein n=1 Tax=Terasakiella pusilla TaxID=64973 RepID=UPI00048FBB7B|nr:hypothetical protein [Terasakiella pusilla]
MNLTQDFLVKSGIHSFVTYQQCDAQPIFSIKAATHQKMARHAQKLLQNAFGDSTVIRLEK